MINEPTITATCGKCDQTSDPMELTSLAGGGWDDRNIERKLQKDGWKIQGSTTICPDCQSEEKG